MLKENYLNDPNKIVNQVGGSGGYIPGRDRKYQGDFKRRYDDRDRDDRRKKEYIDYDDPNIAAK